MVRLSFFISLSLFIAFSIVLKTETAYSDEFIAVKKVYSMPLLTLDLQKRNINLLHTAMRDLENFYLIAGYLRRYHAEDMKLFEKFAREYMIEGIDSLLERERTDYNDDMKKMLLDLQYLKALFYYELQDIDMACKTIKDIESQYYQSRSVDVGFMGKNNTMKSVKPYMVMTNFRYVCKQLYSELPGGKPGMNKEADRGSE